MMNAFLGMLGIGGTMIVVLGFVFGTIILLIKVGVFDALEKMGNPPRKHHTGPYPTRPSTLPKGNRMSRCGGFSITPDGDYDFPE